jgi:hypothetical protein
MRPISPRGRTHGLVFVRDDEVAFLDVLPVGRPARFDVDDLDAALHAERAALFRSQV